MNAPTGPAMRADYGPRGTWSKPPLVAEVRPSSHARYAAEPELRMAAPADGAHGRSRPPHVRSAVQHRDHRFCAVRPLLRSSSLKVAGFPYARRHCTASLRAAF